MLTWFYFWSFFDRLGFEQTFRYYYIYFNVINPLHQSNIRNSFQEYYTAEQPMDSLYDPSEGGPHIENVF